MDNQDLARLAQECKDSLDSLPKSSQPSWYRKYKERLSQEPTLEEYVERHGDCPCGGENYSPGDCPEHDCHIPERWLS